MLGRLFIDEFRFDALAVNIACIVETCRKVRNNSRRVRLTFESVKRLNHPLKINKKVNRIRFQTSVSFIFLVCWIRSPVLVYNMQTFFVKLLGQNFWRCEHASLFLELKVQLSYCSAFIDPGRCLPQFLDYQPRLCANDTPSPKENLLDLLLIMTDWLPATISFHATNVTLVLEPRQAYRSALASPSITREWSL